MRAQEYAPRHIHRLCFAQYLGVADRDGPRASLHCGLDNVDGASTRVVARPESRQSSRPDYSAQLAIAVGLADHADTRSAEFFGDDGLEGHHVRSVAHPPHCLVDRIIAHEFQVRLLSGKHLLEAARVAMQLA